MRAILAAATLALLAAPAAALQEDFVDRMVQRLRNQLQLSEEQTSKVRDILKKQDDDLRNALTPEQRTRYDEQFQRFGRGGGGGGFRAQWWPSTEELRSQLSLTDDQVAKVNEIRDDIREEMRTFWQNRQGGGGNPGDEFQAFLTKIRDDSTKKLRDVLNDTQKTKFDEISHSYQARADPGGDRRGPSVDERVSRAMDSLRIENAEEAQAIKGEVRKVVELMEKLEAYRRDSRQKLEEASRNRELSEEAIADKIEELREGSREIEEKLSAARAELADAVTNRQTLELIRRGILR
jgi:hypothetical protein